MRWLDPSTDPIELDAVYVVDLAHPDTIRYRHPGDRDPLDLWAAVAYRGPRGVCFALARPTMSAFGAALGAAGLLGNRRVLGQLRSLCWSTTGGAHVDAEAPPDDAAERLRAHLA